MVLMACAFMRACVLNECLYVCMLVFVCVCGCVLGGSRKISEMGLGDRNRERQIGECGEKEWGQGDS